MDSRVQFYSFLEKFLEKFLNSRDAEVGLITLELWNDVPRLLSVEEPLKISGPETEGYEPSLSEILNELLNRIIEDTLSHLDNDLPSRIILIFDLFILVHGKAGFPDRPIAFTMILRLLLQVYTSSGDSGILTRSFDPKRVLAFFSFAYKIGLKPLDHLVDCVRSDKTPHSIPEDLTELILPDPSELSWAATSSSVRKEKLDEFFKLVTRCLATESEGGHENWQNTLTRAIMFVDSAVQVYHRDRGWKEMLVSWDIILKEEIEKDRGSRYTSALQEMRELLSNGSGRDFYPWPESFGTNDYQIPTVLKEAIESNKYSFDEHVFRSSFHALIVLRLSFPDAPGANVINSDLPQTLESYFDVNLRDRDVYQEGLAVCYDYVASRSLPCLPKNIAATILESMREAYIYNGKVVSQQLKGLFKQFLQRKPNDSDLKKFSRRVFAERWRTLDDLVVFVSKVRGDYSEDNSWGEVLSHWKHMIEESIINEDRTTASSTELVEGDKGEKYNLQILLKHLNHVIEQGKSDQRKRNQGRLWPLSWPFTNGIRAERLTPDAVV